MCIFENPCSNVMYLEWVGYREDKNDVEKIGAGN